ncbi:MAG: SDR family NAD(P)-dependent oxidoreductase [Candidatus Aminicenantes bacterium]|nr:SDR family NAD(P)-dependent oxidoreductase [Candidatus Aminicenantes bacterium]NIQ68365.1 SDR family NAD(P)-dependent oxidoreductase [Candidatus Aminicenantes bacterium]NIT24408.1 SDR family NAD(P)-dependent oxidoreductase [Candidatus Aminicenantes bacterium]
MEHAKTSHTAEEIQSWLISQICQRLGMGPEEIDIREPFTDLGLSSREAIVISGDLEEWLGCRLSPTLLYEYPNIETISQYLAHGSNVLKEGTIIDETPGSDVQEIAVIGIGCRFPGANGPDAFWELLRDGVDAIAEVPPDRWDIDFFYDPDPEKPGKMNTRWGGFLEHIAQFDPHFFGISPREAAQMDPQQRLLLEVSWEALEDAGQVKERLGGSKTGIFVGISTNEYGRFQGSDPKLIDAYLGTGNALSIAANRLSYFFNFRGPSIAVDTACSSSLLAVHLACRSLSSGESFLALAGGVNLILSPEITINFSKAGFMAPDGRCKAFDARADGYVRGEGVGMVVLKLLSNALADNDPIYAVIRGSATNQDGRSNGLTAPNQQAQQEVLREAFARAGVSPGQIQYIETHGTGTALGDPIEAKALGTVLAANRPPGNPCIIGSVKTNIGHLESAAGIAGLIKVALSLKHGIIPPNLHYQEPNPHIPFDELQLQVQQHPGPWPQASGPALAGVSSFGFGGTNAHVVLEEAPRVSMIQQQEETPSNRAYLLTLSAHSPEALQSMAKAYKDFLTIGQNGSLYDICYTASVRRSHHKHRMALVGHSREKLSQHLDTFFQGETRLPGLSSGCKPQKGQQKLVFVFSGQGSQYLGMGRELLDQESVFRETLHQCDREIQRQANWSLLDELTADEVHSRLEEIDVMQPVLFSIQVALAALWQSWGIKPDAVMGYSLGEIAATHVSGALNLEDAVRVICSRSRLLKQIKGQGKLAVVELSLEETQQELTGWENRVSIAASSSPTITVLSGDPEPLQEFVETLQNQGIFCVLRKEDVAVHAHQLDPLLNDLLQSLEGLDPQSASIPIYSTVSGTLSEGPMFDAAYWVRNLREPVLFSTAVQEMLKDGYEIFLELSPHPIHLSSIQEWMHFLRKKGRVLPSLRRKKKEREVILDSLGALYAQGFQVNWSKLYPQKGRCLWLPSYTWQRKRYWFETTAFKDSGRVVFPSGYSGEGINNWLYKIEWKPKARMEAEQTTKGIQPDQQGSWLIFSDRDGVGASLAELLQKRGEPYVMVFPGETYEISKQEHFKIDPTQPEDFHRLLKEAYGDGQRQLPCHRVVHLWSLDAVGWEETTVSSLKAAQVLGSGSVLHLVQALAAAGLPGFPRLWLVTRGAQPVGSKTGPLSVAQAPLWGLGNVIALELPELHPVRVDLDPMAKTDEARVLFEEIRCQDQEQDQGQEDQIAFRLGVRHVRRLAFHNSPPPAAPGPAAVFSPDGTYLITGGLGGLGLKVAQWMVEQGARHLVLMGRRGASAAAQEVLDTMAEAGVRAVVFKADVSQEDQVAGMLAEISQSMPPLKGIIHAAGVLEDGMLMQQKWEHFTRVMASKVEGAWILHTLTLDTPLDFFILFSSAISLLGSFGVGNYAAANAFLDTLAHHRRNQGLVAMSINWGPWAEVGMAANLGSRGMRQWAAAGISMIAPDQGLQVLVQLLGQLHAQITILPIKWSEFIRQFPLKGSPPPLFSEVLRGLNMEGKDDRVLKPQPELVQRLEAAVPGERRHLLADYLQDQVIKVLQLDPSHPVEPQQGLFDMGMDSLMAMELKKRIETSLGISLPSVLTFNYSTIESLVEYLESKMLSLESPEKPGEITTRFAEFTHPESGPIAIIGMGCRFPGGCSDLETFWQLLHDGVDAITEIPADRWDVDAFYDPNPDTPGKTYVRWGGFLDQVDQFDAQFFGISPREAVSMDPQQRILLEVSWEALENAGQVKDKRIDSHTGVFIGLASNDYLRLQMNTNDSKRIDNYTGTGTAPCVTSGRLSYILGLQGPNLTLDTACSSSLVAVHLACQSLLSGECDMALAGGVSLILSPESIIYFSKLGALSRDGRCKTFDAAADGYVQGEGCGVVVLKRLSDAEAAGDNILAIIRGSAINHGGRSSGLTVPNGLAQQAVIREAMAKAGVTPVQVSYVEAHGTGTSLGDPIEVQALAAVMGEERSNDQPLKIGSVKTNIGHLEAAAGVAGLIKVVLAMQHQEIPPHLNFHDPNHHIPWEEIPIQVQRGRTPWPLAKGRRIAGLSSFGISGTNAHLVLEQPPQSPPVPPQDEVTPARPYLLPISAHNPEALQAMAKAYQDFLANDGPFAAAPLQDICYTASIRRNHLDYRLALVDYSREKLSQHLDAFLQGETRLPGLSSGCKPLKRQQKLVFVFSGQGSQWPGMGQELLDQEPVFRETIRQCDREIQRQANWSLLEELAADEVHSRLEEIDVMQPVLFSIQVALAALWQSWGIKPDAVVGYSLGEIAATHVSGALNLEEAVRVICSRSRLLKQLKGQGSLAVVELSLEKTQQALSGWDNRVSIAASSSPTITVLSGDPEALPEVLETLKNQGIFCVPREEDVAVHTQQLDPLCAELAQCLEGLEHQPASIPIYSTVTGKTSQDLVFDAAYWVRNLREPVLFSAAVQQMLEDGYEIFLEISPHPILSSSVQEWMHFLRRKGTVLPSLRKKKSEPGVILDSFGTLYTLGFEVNWGKLYPQKGRCLWLPTYTWQRKRYWIDTPKPGSKGTTAFSQEWAPGSMLHPLLDQRLHSPLNEILFESRISTDSLPFLQDHRVGGMVIFSIASYLEMILAAVAEAFGSDQYILEEAAIHEPLVLSEGDVQTVQLILGPGEPGEFSFQVFSLAAETGRESSSWRLHAEGKARTGNPDKTSFTDKAISPEEIIGQYQEELSAGWYYQKLKENELDYGANFQGIKKVWRKDGEALGQLSLPESLVSNVGEYYVHPALLEASFQLFAAALSGKDEWNVKGGIYLPFALESYRFFNRPGTRLWSQAFLRQGDPLKEEILGGDFILINETGEVAAEVKGMMFKRVSQEALKRTTKEQSGDWLYQVEWKPKACVQSDQAPDQEQSDKQGTWLIFSDREGLGASLADLLEKLGESYVIVFPGETYENSKEEHFKIDPTQPEDFHRLLKEAYGGGQPRVHHVVYLWSLDTVPPGKMTAASLETDQALSCGSVLYLCQALVAAGWSKLPRLWLVTKGGQLVDPETDVVALAQAPLWGLGHVIAIEHPQLRCARVDIDPSGETDETQSLFEEIRVQDQDQEDRVAFRRGVRYVPRLVFHESKSHEAAVFRSDSTYLITGGLGGIGLTVAKWMVEQGARHLVLVGRSKGSAAAREAVDALNKDDVRVVTARADVTREDQVAGVLAEISQSMPPLKGIIHAAGTLDDGVLHLLDWERFAKVLAPKVEGSWNLHALTRDIPLDFFVLFSSVASLLGANSQGNYVAGNAFLDALAHYRKRQGLPALCLNWGPWTEVGTAAALASRYKRRWKAMGMDTIPTEKGLQILGQMLRQDSAQVAILPINWQEFMQQFATSGASLPLLSDLVQEAHPGMKTRQQSLQQTELLQRIKAAPRAERRGLLFAHVKDQVIKVLQLEPSHPVEPQQGLFDMGMDSLMAIELKNRIETSLGIPLPSVLTFNYSTIESLAEHLESKMVPLEAPEKSGEAAAGFDEIKHSKTEPIAIIGMSCRFPGNCDNPEAFWSLLRDGVDAITEVPADRWDADALFDPNPDTPGKMNTKWGAFLEDVDGFDASFFGISPREAINMDPQQRILLEVTWEALENAGQIKDKRGDSQTGIFIGLATNDYLRLQATLNDLNCIDAYTGTGTAACITSGRLSYILGLQGPNMTLDTACSSSLVAVHLACQSLHNRECDLALAGGVNLILLPEVAAYYSRIHVMASDGRCKTFDAAADGFVRGEGCGVVVLKRLSDAEADGDNILALIRGSAINHDGHTSGLTVPNGLAQEAVIGKALANAGVNPLQVNYVEAHGTGTSLGDPIEVQALAAVLGKERSNDHSLLIGSVKTNIGHLEAAAGAAGLMKVVLAMNHNEIPPHLHFKTPNPHIKWEEIPIEVPTERTPWPATGEPRIAGVSSFGFSGTNAHVVLEEAPRVPEDQQQEELPGDGAYLLPISAHNPEALQWVVKNYLEFLTANGSNPAILLHDLCCTASLRRNHHLYRLALVGNTREELITQLKVFLQGESASGLYSGKKPQDHRQKLVFVFPGQGNQWPGMGLKLMDREPVFRETLQQCDQLLGHYTDWSLLDVLKANDKKSRLQDTEVAQPTIFALQAALASLWKSWGIVPDAVVGHSVGELAAAYTAGVLSLEEAIQVVYYRGKLMQKMAGLGKMVAVGLSREEAEQILVEYNDRLGIAAFNSPISTVLSGEPADVEEVNNRLQKKEIFSRILKVNYAFHSPQMDLARDELVQALPGLDPQPASLPIFSTVTGKSSEDLTFDALYWGRNMREPVLFSAAVQQLLEKGYEIFLELSPHPTLITSVREGLDFLSKEGTVLPSLHREKDDRAVLLGSLGALYTRGNSPDWRKLYPSGGRFVQLPAYPWQHERYWLETRDVNMRSNRERTQDNRMEPQQTIDTLPGNVDDWFYKLHWQPAALSKNQQAPGPLLQPAGETWLIFTDSSGIGKALTRHLVKQGEPCILVSPGDTYKRTYKGKDREYFRIHPGRQEDFQQLLKNTIGPGLPGCRGIVHLWGVDIDPAGETTAASLEMAQTLGCSSILYLVRELAAAGLQTFPRLWLVTRGVQPVEESHGPLAVAGSPIWGFGSVMAVEHPEFWGGLVDLDPGESREKCSLHLLECIKNPGSEDQLAFRQGECYAARLLRSREAALQSHSIRWRPDGSYLVTGGLGDLGLQVARWMVEQGARRLILLGRTRVPRRSQWGKIDKKSRLAHQVACIRELEAMGASVHLASVDVAEEKQLASFLKKFHNENWPPIRGVIHAAGLVQVKTLVTISVEDLTTVLRPKVLGGWLLHRLLKDAPLDFFVLFSSAASLLNPPMLSSYAAANTFLDILAHHRRASGLPALGINWGAWSEVGMMARQLQTVGRNAMPHGMGSFTPKQGVEVLGRLLCQDSVQVGVMPFDWQQFFRSYPAASRLPLLTHMVRETPLSREDREEKGRLTPDALLKANTEDRKTLLESYLRDQLARILQLPADRVDVHQSILELGIDSLTSIELQNQLKADLGLSIPVAAFLQGHSLARLAAQVLDQLPGAGPAPVPKTPAAPETAKQLLANIDKLSDEEVEQLLNEISAAEEDNK